MIAGAFGPTGVQVPVIGQGPWRMGEDPSPHHIDTAEMHGNTIPKASRPEHVRENAAALDFALTPEDVAAIEAAFR